jgi:very-short-patch-repair endonuclease
MEYALIFVIIILMMDLIITKIPKQEKIENEDLSSLYEKKTYLLTQNELKFYKLLKSITDKNNLNLFSQVALYEIIKSKNIKYFNKIKSKTIDFVITDVNCKIKLCIELDDPTHIKENRQKRDKFVDNLFKELNIKLIRIPVQSYYKLNELENKIKESL